MNEVAIAYDNFSGNTGDLAVGWSLRKILNDLKIPHDEIFDFKEVEKYKTIIVGGGLLLRPLAYKVYDNFRLQGNHILNCMGIWMEPENLEYLNDYKYLSVRSEGDKKKLSNITKEIKVVPCTTMLLQHPIGKSPLKNKTVGIHVFKELFYTEEDELEFVQFVNSLMADGLDVLFIPIAHYRDDESYFSPAL